MYKAVVALFYNLLPRPGRHASFLFYPDHRCTIKVGDTHVVGTVKASGGFLFNIHVHYSVHMYSYSQVYAW